MSISYNVFIKGNTTCVFRLRKTFWTKTFPNRFYDKTTKIGDDTYGVQCRFRVSWTSTDPNANTVSTDKSLVMRLTSNNTDTKTSPEGRLTCTETYRSYTVSTRILNTTAICLNTNKSIGRSSGLPCTSSVSLKESTLCKFFNLS